MNEAGPVAVADAAAGGHVLLQHCLYVEILDAKGRPVPSGERGEVALTGGFNFCLPLLRYRTGDYAALQFSEAEPVLIGLEGRPPVTFRTMNGERINNIEVTHALKNFALSQFSLHQDGHGRLRFRLAGPAQPLEPIRQALLSLFGPGQPVDLDVVESLGEKVVQYTSELKEEGL
jgi:phenylacetate-CoA ligase